MQLSQFCYHLYREARSLTPIHMIVKQKFLHQIAIDMLFFFFFRCCQMNPSACNHEIANSVRKNKQNAHEQNMRSSTGINKEINATGQRMSKLLCQCIFCILFRLIKKSKSPYHLCYFFFIH